MFLWILNLINYAPLIWMFCKKNYLFQNAENSP